MDGRAIRIKSCLTYESNTMLGLHKGRCTMPQTHINGRSVHGHKLEATYETRLQLIISVIRK